MAIWTNEVNISFNLTYMSSTDEEDRRREEGGKETNEENGRRLEKHKAKVNLTSSIIIIWGDKTFGLFLSKK